MDIYIEVGQSPYYSGAARFNYLLAVHILIWQGTILVKGRFSWKKELKHTTYQWRLIPFPSHPVLAMVSLVRIGRLDLKFQPREE